MNDYWLPELPPAEDRLKLADSKLSRDAQEEAFYAFRECNYQADCLSTGRMLRNLFWILVTAGLLAACVWGALCL